MSKNLQEKLEMLELTKARGIVVADGLAIRSLTDDAQKQIKEWIHIVPLGEWKAFNYPGDVRVITKKMLNEMISNFEANNIDILVDYEHRSLWGNSTAAGWITEIAIKKDGLWGKVKWNATAQAQILADEYRYLSPCWLWNYVDPISGESKGCKILSVALTNFPAFDTELEQIIAASGSLQKEQETMSLKNIAKQFGLAETATEDEVLTACKSLQTKADQKQNPEIQAMSASLTAVRNELKLPSTASESELIAAIQSRGAQESQLAIQVREMQAKQNKAEAKALVDKAQADGKIVAAMRPWAEELAEKDASEFIKWAAVAPVILAPESKTQMPIGSDGKGIPTEAEKWASKTMGVPVEEIVAARVRKEQAAA